MSSSLLPENFSNILLRIPVNNWSFEKIAENEKIKTKKPKTDKQKRRVTVEQVAGTTFLTR